MVSNHDSIQATIDVQIAAHPGRYFFACSQAPSQPEIHYARLDAKLSPQPKHLATGD